jgi:hypothetical protein
MIFPTVKGNNLEKKQYKLPQDFEGKLNIVTVAFQQWQQGLVNSWVPFLEEIKQTHPEISFYELPTMSRGYKGMKFMIDGGMRMGIPDKNIRSRTITLYLDKKKFMKNLDINNDETIITFLVDTKGEIYLKIKGEFDSEKGKQIASKVNELLSKNN